MENSELQCQYRRAACTNARVMMTNGKLHRFCETHRNRAYPPPGRRRRGNAVHQKTCLEVPTERSQYDVPSANRKLIGGTDCAHRSWVPTTESDLTGPLFLDEADVSRLIELVVHYTITS
jgi:hypothetical protein